MKKITLLFVLLAVSLGYSQTEIAVNGDFETGDDTGWLLFQNGGTAALDNTIANGGTWSGKLETGGASNPALKQEAIGVGTVTAGGLVTITFDHIGSVVQPGAVFNVLLFGEGATGASFTHVFNPAPVLAGTWTEFSANYTIPMGTDVTGGVSFLIEAVCGADAGCSVSANIDNVSLTVSGGAAPTCDDGIMNGDEEGVDCGGSCPDACPATEPTDAPPAPTADAADVISLFSDEYTDLAATWNPAWGQTTVVTDETIASNPVKKYSNFTFSGIEPTGGTIDATAAPAKTHINVDYWTSDATELKIKLVDYRGDGAWGGDNIEVEITKPVTTGAWGVVSIALSEFTEINPTMILSDIGQLVLSATGATNPVYIDNLYFVNSPTAGLDDFDSASFNVYPNPSNNVWNVKSNNTVINAIHVFDVLGKQVLSLQPKSNNVSIDANELTKGLYFAKIESDTGISSIKLIKN